jgi:hypothetical protein
MWFSRCICWCRPLQIQQEFLVHIGIAGAIPFGNAMSAHGAPLVVIALQPDLEPIGKAPSPERVIE